jgi:hypothetical protein
VVVDDAADLFDRASPVVAALAGDLRIGIELTPVDATLDLIERDWADRVGFADSDHPDQLSPQPTRLFALAWIFHGTAAFVSSGARTARRAHTMIAHPAGGASCTARRALHGGAF